MSNPVCAIVGVGSGVSLAVARRFGREGFALALLARRAEAVEAHAADLSSAGLVARSFAADAADKAAMQRAFAQIRDQMGEPDILVYNAAVLRQGQPSELDSEVLVQDFWVNVVGALLCAQQVIPAMRARQRGTILFTGGGLALQPMAQYASLSMGKAALRNLCYSLGQELEPHNIQVATVTIAGFVQPGTHFDPDRIADAFWNLHAQPSDQRKREFVYQ